MTKSVVGFLALQLRNRVIVPAGKDVCDYVE